MDPSVEPPSIDSFLREQVEPVPAKAIWELKCLRTILNSTVFPGGLIGSSQAIKEIHKLIERTIDRDFQILISGETGTGKELVARCVHLSGTRRKHPFIPVNCTAITSTLFESELFGYVRGSFTGAVRDRLGLFQAAEGGTIFLDEIGDLPRELQAKLLRVIQEKEVRPLGSTQMLPIDVRVIAATNRDLKQAVEKGEFREDLYYRLNVFQIGLPPLRHRKADIPLLVAAFIDKNDDPFRPITSIGEDFWSAVMAYEWPGNVRELENLVARSIALGSGPILHDEGRCILLLRTGQNIERAAAERPAEPLAIVEKRTILKALAETSGDKVAAARILGIGKTTLYRKLKAYSSVSHGPAMSESF